MQGAAQKQDTMEGQCCLHMGNFKYMKHNDVSMENGALNLELETDWDRDIQNILLVDQHKYRFWFP